MNYYKCKYFQIYELIDPITFHKWGEQAWMFFNPHILFSLDQIREYYGKPITVNTWFHGGEFSMRGLRPPTSNIGATYGQHRFGNAFDYDVKGLSAEQVRQDIIEHKDDLFKYVTCLEANVNWVHMDCRNIENRIMLVYPK